MTTSTDAGYRSSSIASRSGDSLPRMIKTGARRETIADFLNSMSPSARVDQVTKIGHALVGKLYDAAGGAEPLAIEDLIAKDERGTVIFEGKNSLPAFTRFQKRFARVGDTVVGYNHQLMSFATGPGYFIVRGPTAGESHPDELFFDYTTDPPGIPTGWPAFKPNDVGTGRLVWMHMKDFCRRVADGVLVGKAYKRGVSQNAYFTLTKPY